MVGGSHILESSPDPSVGYNQGGANHYEYEYTWGKNEKIGDKKIKLTKNIIDSQDTTYYYKNVEISYINSDAYENYEDTDWKSLKVANGGNIEVKYHYYPKDSRDIYVGYFDSSGNRIEIGENPESKEGVLNNVSHSVSNAFYNYNSHAEEKYQTSFQMTFTGEKTVSYNQKNYYLQEIKVHKLGSNEYSGDNKYSKLISYDKELGVFKFNNFNKTIKNTNNYTVAADKQNYYVAFIYSEKPKVTPKIIIECRTESGSILKTDSTSLVTSALTFKYNSKNSYSESTLTENEATIKNNGNNIIIGDNIYQYNSKYKVAYVNEYQASNSNNSSSGQGDTVKINAQNNSSPVIVVTFYYSEYTLVIERRIASSGKIIKLNKKEYSSVSNGNYLSSNDAGYSLYVLTKKHLMSKIQKVD